MKEGPDIARIAALMGDPACANMLTALMDGKALTATELAAEANITPQTAISHLGKMTEAVILRQRKQGRHRYYAINDEYVADVIAGLMGLAEKAGLTRIDNSCQKQTLLQLRRPVETTPQRGPLL